MINSGRRNNNSPRIAVWRSSEPHLKALLMSVNIAASLLFLVLSGCTLDQERIGDVIGAIQVTNSPPAVPVAQPTNTVESQPAQVDGIIAQGVFVRPVIAAGADGRLYVATEGIGMQSIWFYARDKKGVWSGGQVAQSQRGGLIDASRVYVPDIVVDEEGWCWVSMRCGPKEWGKLHGPAVWIRSPSGTGLWKFLNLTTGAARICATPEFPGAVVLLTKNGVYGVVDRTGRVTKQATFPAGTTGEKFDFDISPSGVAWASAHNGYQDQASAVAIGSPSAAKRQPWADYDAYGKWYGNDLCYPSVVIGPAGSVYCLSVYGGRLKLQVFDKGVARFPLNRLADLGAAAQEDRCPPRLVATKTGVQAVFVKGGDIYRVDVEKALSSKAAAVRICAGANPAVCMDKIDANRMHMVYIQAGFLFHKVINL